ncbi:MAG: hypothetical protein AAGF07_02245 [Patescibacteria group bacterium]
MINNPFDREENLQPWFTQDKNYRTAQKLFWQDYLSKTRSERANTNILYTMTYKTLRFISAHTVISVIIGIILFTAIGATTAEALAPEVNKPSTILQRVLEVNQQPEKDPYTALKPDSENNVVSLDACDLSVKFPKQIENISTQASRIDFEMYGIRIQGADFSYKPNLSIPNYENLKLNELSITCADEYFDYYSGEKEAPRITNQELADYTGWFISSESELEDLRIDQGYDYHSILFKHTDKYYYIRGFDLSKQANIDNIESIPDYDPIYDNTIREFRADIDGRKQLPGIFPNQVQLQFNSIASNETNTELTEDKFENQDNYFESPIKTPNNTVQTDLKLKNEQNFNKKINDYEALKAKADQDGRVYRESHFCGIPHLIEYETNGQEQKAYITNQNQYSVEDIIYYDRVVEFLDNPEDTYTETLKPAFRSYCGTSENGTYLAELQNLEFPKVDMFRSIVAMESKDMGEVLRVIVYAKKDNNLIRLSQELDLDNSSKQPNYEEACGSIYYNEDSTTSEKRKCVEEELLRSFKDQLTPEKVAEAEGIAQNLIDTFAIETK